ncbi:MAG: hypothetical protein K2F90_00305 [Clostridiales bacterium]|nr:hypothetical protein [Clostridiales bacterium]
MGLLIKKMFMTLVLWLFELLDTLFSVFKSLAGIDLVNNAGQEVSLTEYFMSQTVLYQVFFGIVVCSILVVAVCMIVAIVKSIVNMKGGDRKSHAKTVGQGVGAVVISLTLAAIMVIGITASDMFLGALYKTMNVNDTTVAQVIFDASVDNIYALDYFNAQGLNKSYKADGSEITNGSYLYDYNGIKFIQEWYILKPYPSNKYAENGLTKFNKPRGENGSEWLEWDEKYEDNPNGVPCYNYNEVWIEVEADSNASLWQELNPPNEETPRTYTQAYRGTDGKYYALNIALLTPVVSSGWLVDEDARKLDFSMETADTIYGEFDTYTLLPCFEDEDDMLRAGKIRVGSFNYVLAFLCGIIVLIALCSTMLGLVKRLYDLVILFLALPLMSGTIPLDDGVKFKLWRETVISKVVLAYGSVFAICVFMLIVPHISGITIAGSAFVNSVFRIFLICGGALTISGGQLLFARLIGGSAEESREMAQSARTLLGGTTAMIGAGRAAGRLVFGYRNANGQRVGGLIKGGASVAGTVGGGAVNAVGTAIGGQAYTGSRIGQAVSKTQQALKGFGSSAGWFGHGGDFNNGGTLGGSISSALGSGAGKFAGSKMAQKSGLNNGLVGLTAGNVQRGIEKRHAKQRDNARQMLGNAQAEINKAYEQAAAARTANVLQRDDFGRGREVMPGFETGEPSVLPAPISGAGTNGKKE